MLLLHRSTALSPKFVPGMRYLAPPAKRAPLDLTPTDTEQDARTQEGDAQVL